MGWLVMGWLGLRTKEKNGSSDEASYIIYKEKCINTYLFEPILAQRGLVRPLLAC